MRKEIAFQNCQRGDNVSDILMGRMQDFVVLTTFQGSLGSPPPTKFFLSFHISFCNLPRCPHFLCYSKGLRAGGMIGPAKELSCIDKPGQVR